MAYDKSSNKYAGSGSETTHNTNVGRQQEAEEREEATDEGTELTGLRPTERLENPNGG